MTRAEMPERDRARINIKRFEGTSMSTGEAHPRTFRRLHSETLAAVRARQADEVHGVNKRGITPVPDTWTAGGPMTGPEHFLRAEQLAEEAHKHLGHGEGQATAAVWAAVAQVHATLAVAAAIEAGSARRDRPEFPTPEIGPLLPGPLPPGTGPLPLT